MFHFLFVFKLFPIKNVEPKVGCILEKHRICEEHYVDYTVYVVQMEDVKFFIVVYVDDLILVRTNKDKFM
jgi:hypothetical protein